LVKPDGARRNLIGEAISRIERKGLKVALGLRAIETDVARERYAEHAELLSSGERAELITSGPLAALVAEGPDAIAAFRQLAGKTNPVAAEAGSIRGSFALQAGQNIVPGSGSPEPAEREIKIFFPELV
jgi:nucleoside-diphosphate kinase